MRISFSIPIFLLAAISSFAQFDAGQISGFVRDNSGAIVSGANVSVANQATGEIHKTTTNAEGYYVFPQLFVGQYSVTVEKTGFKTFVQNSITIDAQAKRSVDVTLSLGAVSERVEVEASAAQVQTDSAKVGSTVENKQIQNLTLNGRNPIYLAALTPGVVGSQGIGTFDPDSVSNGSFNINGGRADEYVVAVDGAVATRTRSSGSMLGALDVDTVQEVQVLTANYSAEYGRSSAGQIRFVTKSGTRNFHGDLVENFRNSALDANTWTRNHSAIAEVAAVPRPIVSINTASTSAVRCSSRNISIPTAISCSFSMPKNGSKGAMRPPIPVLFPALRCAKATSANCLNRPTPISAGFASLTTQPSARLSPET